MKRWRMICPPHHINIFSKSSLTSLANKFGLDILEYNSLSTYVRFIRKLDTGSFLFRRSFFNALRLCGLGADHFFVLGRH
jgi:hypothetical protein